MVISIEQNDGFLSITASGGQTDLDFDFPLYEKSHLQILRTRSGTTTTLVLNTDYTIADGELEQEAGGTAVLVTGATAGDIYTLLLNVPEARTTDFNQAGDFLAETLNRELDLQTQIMQQLRRDVDKSATLPDTSTLTSLELPTPTANKLIGWNSAADALSNYTALDVPAAAVTSFIETLLDDTTAAAARTTLGAAASSSPTITGTMTIATIQATDSGGFIIKDHQGDTVATFGASGVENALVTNAINAAAITITGNVIGGALGIGTSSPASEAHIKAASGECKQIIEAEAASQSAVLQLRTQTATPGQLLVYFGTVAAPTNGQVGYDPNTDELYFYTDNTKRGYFKTGFVVGSPTGGDKGAGTINATAVYDDNVLLTCYPIERYVDGSVDLERWDQIASVTIENEDGTTTTEQRTHAPAHGFVDKMTRVDLLDIDSYVSEWKTKKALPAFYGFEAGKKPTGEAIQRLMETVDIFAIHIDKLNKRLKALENA